MLLIKHIQLNIQNEKSKSGSFYEGDKEKIACIQSTAFEQTQAVKRW